MSVVVDLLYYALTAFFLLLIFRFIMDWVFVLARSFRPSGPLLVALEVCYTVTDPPLKALRRVIPPLRLGGFSLDLGFLVLFLVVSILQKQVASYR